MGILSSIVIGFVIGLLARFITPGRDAMGLILTTLLGIGGAFVGEFIGRSLGMYQQSDPAGWVMSLVGAVILLFVYNRVVSGKNARSS